MNKTCHNCGFIVNENHTGKCPNCGKDEGYETVRSINENVNVEEYVKAEKIAMKNALDETLMRYDKLLSKYDKNKEVFANIKVKRDSLKAQEPEFIANAEKRAKEIAEKRAKEKTTSAVNFTVGAIIGTEEQRKIKELEDKNKELEDKNKELETTADAKEQLLKEIVNLENKTDLTNKGIEKIKDRLSPKQTIGLALVIGLIASIGGSAVYSLITGLSHNIVNISTTNATLP